MANLNDLRKKIDFLDQLMIKVLRDRFLLVHKIRKIKKKQNLPSLDKVRWKHVLSSRLDWADKLGVDKKFIKKVWGLIHTQSLTIEDNDK